MGGEREGAGESGRVAERQRERELERQRNRESERRESKKGGLTSEMFLW